ncbi:unnamed protein product, partial [Polarella glacialis]
VDQRLAGPAWPEVRGCSEHEQECSADARARASTSTDRGSPHYYVWAAMATPRFLRGFGQLQQMMEEVRKHPLVPWADLSQGCAGVILELVFAAVKGGAGSSCRLPGECGCCLQGSLGTPGSSGVDCWGGVSWESVFKVEIVEDAMPLQVRFRGRQGYLRSSGGGKLDLSVHGVAVDQHNIFKVQPRQGTPLMLISSAGG